MTSEQRLLKLSKPEAGLLLGGDIWFGDLIPVNDTLTGLLALLVSSGANLAMPAYFGDVIEAVSTTKSRSELNGAIFTLFIV